MRKISAKHRVELLRKSAHAMLRDRLPEQWVEEINNLPETVRPATARIVWWDWFSMRLVPDRWNHLDQYLTEDRVIPPDNEVIAALMALGYPHQRALKRVYVNPREDICATKGATGYPPTSPTSGGSTAIV